MVERTREIAIDCLGESLKRSMDVLTSSKGIEDECIEHDVGQNGSEGGIDEHGKGFDGRA